MSSQEHAVQMYSFNMLEQREIYLLQWFLSLRKIAVKGGAGSLKQNTYNRVIHKDPLDIV